MFTIQTTLLLSALMADPLSHGDHVRNLTVDGLERTYSVHVPASYSAEKPTPVVLVLHGAGTNAAITVVFTGMNTKAEEAGFVAVYPKGTGKDPSLRWNAGPHPDDPSRNRVDDVKFIAAMLDDLRTVLNVDSKRVYATGMSNGGMMCYRLASELSDRIAAIAPVAGTMAMAEAQPKRPVPVMHFHGTADTFVKYGGRNERSLRLLKSVDETIEIWRKINRCAAEPVVTELPDRVEDGTTVRRKSYGPGKDDSEVILFEIKEGGHTWPGQKPLLKTLGNSTFDISANDLMWEFFEKHPMK